VDQAILFGSHARGTADEWSDVDLAVISPDFGRMPRDLAEARPTNFLGHILAEGKRVYKGGRFSL
jgi:predicted nucleotidyltransferase